MDSGYPAESREQYSYAQLPYQNATSNEFHHQPAPPRKPVPGASSSALPQSECQASDPQLPPSVLPTTSNQRPGVLRLWKWELLSILGSILALAAIVAILKVFENKALTAWKAPISINTVVAILSTVFKGLLITPISNGISQLKWLSFSKQSQGY